MRARRAVRRVVRWGLALVVAGFAALNVLAFNHACSMMRFVDSGARTHPPERLSRGERWLTLLRGVRIPRPHGTATPADVGLGFEALAIPGSDGVRLGAWYCPAASNAPLAIVFMVFSLARRREAAVRSPHLRMARA